MSDEDETSSTSGFFSSLLGDDVTTVDETTVDDMPVAPSSGAGRDWTFVLAWALIGMGVLFVLWALITNG